MPFIRIQLILLYLAGALLIPGLHRAIDPCIAVAEEHVHAESGHDEDHDHPPGAPCDDACVICQLANMPTESAPPPALFTGRILADAESPPPPSTYSIQTHRPIQARAPPTPAA